MEQIEIIKREFTTKLEKEYKDSIFLQYNGLYDDAIIGITTNRRIVYNYFELQNRFCLDYLSGICNFEDDITLTSGQENYIEESVISIENHAKKRYKEKSPVFCKDKHFITEILPTLKENNKSHFEIE